MGSIKVAIWRKLFHRDRLFVNGKFELFIFVPDRHGFDECSGGKIAVARSACSRAGNARADRVGDTGFEYQLGRRRDLGKLDDVFPDLFRRGVDDDAGGDRKSFRLRLITVLEIAGGGKQKYERGKAAEHIFMPLGKTLIQRVSSSSPPTR